MLGVPEEKFWESIPIELEPYRKMDKMQQERLDQNMWLMGLYVTNAVSVAVSNALNGKKSKAKYLKEPILQAEKRHEESNPQADFDKFCAWVVVYNENFKSRNRQG